MRGFAAGFAVFAGAVCGFDFAFVCEKPPVENNNAAQITSTDLFIDKIIQASEFQLPREAVSKALAQT